MEIIIGLLVVILFLVYNFTKDMKEKNVELNQTGGISKKYSELIAGFDNFDNTQPPKVLVNDTNFYQMGWAGPTTLASVSIFEVLGNVNIEFELQYNKQGLERMGVDISSLKPLHKKEKWSYNSNSDQFDIFMSVAKKIENLCNL